MYNLKIFKYPNGWQVRAYSKPVGMNNYVPIDNELDMEYLNINGDLVHVTLGSESHRTDGSFLAINPFTGDMERMHEEYERSESEKDRSIKVSMNRTINKVYSYARSNVWDWFVTLTFNPEKVDSFSYEECVKRLQNWLIVQRRLCPDMKYIIVPEQHKSGRFHFHGLFADCDGLEFADSGLTDKKGNPIYNIGRYRLGFSTATKVVDNERVTKYISKYITKELCSVSFGKKRYWCSRNLNECEAEEFLLEANEMAEYMEYFKSLCKWSKEITSADIATTYLEFGGGLDV